MRGNFAAIYWAVKVRAMTHSIGQVEEAKATVIVKDKPDPVVTPDQVIKTSARKFRTREETDEKATVTVVLKKAKPLLRRISDALTEGESCYFEAGDLIGQLIEETGWRINFAAEKLKRWKSPMLYKLRLTSGYFDKEIRKDALKIASWHDCYVTASRRRKRQGDHLPILEHLKAVVAEKPKPKEDDDFTKLFKARLRMVPGKVKTYNNSCAYGFKMYQHAKRIQSIIADAIEAGKFWQVDAESIRNDLNIFVDALDKGEDPRLVTEMIGRGVSGLAGEAVMLARSKKEYGDCFPSPENTSDSSLNPPAQGS